MSIDRSTESVRASQGPSPLFRELIKCADEVMQKLPTSHTGTEYSPKDAYALLDSVLEETKCFDKIKQSVKNHLNFDKLTIRLIRDPFINGSLQCEYDLTTLKKFPFMNRKQSGATAAIQIRTLRSTTVDPLSGVFSVPTKYRDCFTADMTLNSGVFVIHLLYPTARALTPDEIAALILHELGHLVYMTIKTGSFYEYNNLVTDIIPTGTISVKDIQKACASLIEFIDPMIDLITTTVRPYEKTFADNLLGELSGLKAVVTATHKGTLQPVPDINLLNSKIHFVSEIVKIYISIFYSDLPETALFPTKITETIDEREADEFAVRNGAGAAQASLDVYLTTYMEEVLPKDYAKTADKLTGVKYFLFSCALFFSNATYLKACEVTTCYDFIAERLRQGLETAYPILKQSDLSDADRDYYLEQIADAKATIAAYNKIPYVKIRNTLHAFVSTMSDMARSPYTIFLHRLGEQYGCLQQFTASLIRTVLSYHSARIDKLTR